MIVKEIQKPSETKTIERYGYFITDQNGLFNGHIGLGEKEENLNELEWSYSAYKRPLFCHGNRKLAEAEILKLRELRDLGGFPKELDWKIKYLNIRENLIPCNSYIPGNHVFETLDIPKGFKTKKSKSCDAIYKKYKPIFKQISDEDRKEHAAV